MPTIPKGHQFLIDHGIAYHVDAEGITHVPGSIDLSVSGLTCLPFGDIRLHVAGDFEVGGNFLTDLVGGPEHVGRRFVCYDNKLRSLKGGPKSVGGLYACDGNELITLVGAALTVGGPFHCRQNRLQNLDGGPREVGGDYDCSGNQITTLADSPLHLGGSYYCHNNKLPRLAGAPARINGHFRCDGNQLEDLIGGPTSVTGDYACSENVLNCLKGGPQEVGHNFYCSNNLLGTLADAPCNIGREIYYSRNAASDAQLERTLPLPDDLHECARRGLLNRVSLNRITSDSLALLNEEGVSVIEVAKKHGHLDQIPEALRGPQALESVIVAPGNPLRASHDRLLRELSDLTGFVTKFGDTLNRGDFMRAAQGYLQGARTAIAAAKDEGMGGAGASLQPNPPRKTRR